MELEAASRIAVVGGSLTGPAAALLLTRAGFTNLSLYEAIPGAAPQGGGVIGLDHVSLDILGQMGIDLDEICEFPSERVISIRISRRDEIDRLETVYAGRNTTWSLLHRALRSRLPEQLFRAGYKLIDLGVAPDERAELRFANGEREAADLVIFADGRQSVGRRLLDPGRTLSYGGYVAYRGQASDVSVPDAAFVRMEPTVGQFNLFPIRQGAGVGVDWTLYLNTPAAEFERQFGAHPTRRSFVLPHQMSRRAIHYVDHATRLLTEAAARMVTRTTARMAAPVLDIAAPTRMAFDVGRSQAVLIGDALAPVRPHTARGANNGLDQAAGLEIALRQHRYHGADLAAALGGWEQRYLPMVARDLARGPEMALRLGLGVR